MKAFPKTNDVIAISLIKIFIDGPLVSFIGSPTVSPTIAFLWTSVLFWLLTPLTIKWPASIYFFALSQAPPVFENEIAIYTPETIAPAKRPLTPRGPSKKPKNKGEAITNNPGAIISRNEALVEI